MSEQMLAEYRTQAANHNIHARVSVADTQKLPFPDNSFDYVVDTFGLCSVENPVEALKEIQRVCKSDGTILLLEHGKSHSSKWMTGYLDKHAENHAVSWGCWWNRDIVKMMQEAKLTVTQVSTHHLGTCYYVVANPGSGA
eukprot:GFYU01030895.1.p1 GENE.GFYU01030895.1~~GFYU01030895.1.p1  ORF type:complete len:140 (-),score=37.81 GFYU01030895.1:126-545(-)